MIFSKDFEGLKLYFKYLDKIPGIDLDHEIWLKDLKTYGNIENPMSGYAEYYIKEYDEAGLIKYYGRIKVFFDKQWNSWNIDFDNPDLSLLNIIFHN